jgi:hypothetical protein
MCSLRNPLRSLRVMDLLSLFLCKFIVVRMKTLRNPLRSLRVMDLYSLFLYKIIVVSL